MGAFHDILIKYQSPQGVQESLYPQTHLEKALRAFIKEHQGDHPRPGPKQIVGVFTVEGEKQTPIKEATLRIAIRETLTAAMQELPSADQEMLAFLRPEIPEGERSTSFALGVARKLATSYATLWK